MKKRLAAAVTMRDLKTYLAGPDWNISGISKDSIEADSDMYEFAFKAGAFKYSATVTAVDDPSDSESGIVDDPIKWLNEFLGHGAGGGHFASPADVSEILMKVADAIDSGTASRKRTAAAMRLILAYLQTSKAPPADREDVERMELHELKDHMERLGWKVKESTADHGVPSVDVDISGIYRAEIYVSEITWDYSLQVKDVPSSKTVGKTGDPIGTVRKWRGEPSTAQARWERESKRRDPKADQAPRPKEDEEGLTRR